MVYVGVQTNIRVEVVGERGLNDNVLSVNGDTETQ